MILYVFDIRAGDKSKYWRIKRLFYYHLKKISLNKKIESKTKSVLLVEDSLEKKMDRLFSKFRKNMELYKFHVEDIS